jgi:rRNA methylases
MSEQIEGRNAVLEAFRSGKCVDKLFILDGCQDGPVRTIAREARKKDTIINYVAKERLDQLSETGAHQGVIAQVAAYEYASVEDILAKAREKEKIPLSLSWIILRILIILVRSSVQQTLQVHMG